MPLAPDTTIERYLVRDTIGEGGMARVYRVEHTQLGSTHALKVLTTPSAAVRERLLQEGRAQAQLRHPNIVSVTDVVDVDGSPGLVMEYISGPTLADLMKAHHADGLNGPLLALPQVDQLARGIVSGVLAAHEHGLVHRDLKPSNILLEITETGVVPKVADFGLVKVISGEHSADTSMTRSGMALGTPPFMAPEQIRDSKTVDQRGDIFALGAILYELLTGHRAFVGSDMMEIFQAVCQAEYKPILPIRQDAPERMCRSIEGALVVDLDTRIQSCRALLDSWCAGSPVSRTWTETELSWTQEYLTELRSMGSGSRPAPQNIQMTQSDTHIWNSSIQEVPAGTPPKGTTLIQSPSANEMAADQTLSRELPAPQEASLRPAPRRRTGLVLSLALVAAAGGGWWWTETRTIEPESNGVRLKPTAPAAQQADTDPPDSPRSSSAIGTDMDEREPERPSSEEPSPEPEKAAAKFVQPAEPKPPPPASKSSFGFSGPVRGVRLRGGGKLYSPGELPAGSYQIYLRVDGGDPKRVGTTTIPKGKHVLLTCNPLGCK
jgi:serine/threonine protein kinase